MTFEEWWNTARIPRGFIGDDRGALARAFKEVAEDAWEQSHLDMIGRMNQENLLRYLDSIETVN